MSIKDISEYIKSKGKKAKENKDEDHKKRIGPFKLLPPMVIRMALKLSTWLAFNLGIDITPLAVKKNTFGAATVTSIGSLGLNDAIVPFTPFMNNSIMLSVG